MRSERNRRSDLWATRPLRTHTRNGKSVIDTASCEERSIAATADGTPAAPPSFGRRLPHLARTPDDSALRRCRPAAFEGSEDERLALFHQTHSELERRIELFVNLPIESLGRPSLKRRLG